MQSSYSYNSRVFMTRLTNCQNPSSPLNAFSEFSNMSYNALGQRLHMDINIPAQVYVDMSGSHTVYPDASGTVDYQYDDNGRLSRETSSRNNNSPYHGTYDFLYTWDAASNQTGILLPGQSYNANNQANWLAYDGDGNLGSGFRYDYEDRFQGVSSADFLHFGYRGDGLRSWQIDWTVVPTPSFSYFLYDGTNLICELDASGNLTWAYGYGAKGLAQEAQMIAGSLNPFTISFDPQGSSLSPHWFSVPGELSVRDAFGRFRGNSLYNPIVLRIRDPAGFVSQWGALDMICAGGPQLGTLMTHRMYGAFVFWTRDPLSYDGGANLYTYVGGDPVNRVDPLGLDEKQNIVQRGMAWVGNAITTPFRWGWQKLRGAFTVKMDPNAPTFKKAWVEAGISENMQPGAQLRLHGHEIPEYIDETAAGAMRDVALVGLSKLAEGGGAAAAEPNGGTYFLRDRGTGQVMRTGRTGNLAVRKGAHAREFPDLKFEVDKRTDSYFAQRGREQIIHELHSPPLNKINPIWEHNPLKPLYMRAGRKLGP